MGLDLEEVCWEEGKGHWKLVIGKKCTRASEDSERALRLDLDIDGHLKEGSSSQCGRGDRKL